MWLTLACIFAYAAFCPLLFLQSSLFNFLADLLLVVLFMTDVALMIKSPLYLGYSVPAVGLLLYLVLLSFS